MDELACAHRHSIRHRAEIVASTSCGCFHCGAVFRPAEIVVWVDDGATALCPHCAMDAVIGEASGFPATTAAFLDRMNRRWFVPAEDDPEDEAD